MSAPGTTPNDLCADGALPVLTDEPWKPDTSALDACVVAYVREAAWRVTGGNCTFVDMDLGILEHLARRAVVAGLTDGLHPSVAMTARLQAAEGFPEKPDGTGGAPSPPVIENDGPGIAQDLPIPNSQENGGGA